MKKFLKKFLIAVAAVILSQIACVLAYKQSMRAEAKKFCEQYSAGVPFDAKAFRSQLPGWLRIDTMDGSLPPGFEGEFRAVRYFPFDNGSYSCFFEVKQGQVRFVRTQ